MKKVINTKKDAIEYMKGVYFKWPAFFKHHAPMRTSFEIIFEDDRTNKRSINLNDPIKVKLNDFGRSIFFHRYDELIGRGLNLERKYPETDKDGYSTFQLWDFISLYGKYLGMGSSLVLEDLNIYIVEDKDE